MTTKKKAENISIEEAVRDECKVLRAIREICRKELITAFPEYHINEAALAIYRKLE